MCPSYSELGHLRWSTPLVVDGVEDVPRLDSSLLRRTVIEYVQKHPAFALLGLGSLRKAWLNLDVVWAGAPIATGVVILL